MQNFSLKIFNEEGNKRYQAIFLKTHTQLLLQAGANAHFDGGTPERNYMRLMGILKTLVDMEIDKVNRALALLGQPEF